MDILKVNDLKNRKENKQLIFTYMLHLNAWIKANLKERISMKLKHLSIMLLPGLLAACSGTLILAT
ncbi:MULTISPECIES: hypothetical protein [unclassified Oleiphilus]|uniref:hypothetical protein n=1 Tax=unclassified Oleiphilus TaxID=2631174 RepID=UPI0007C25FA1|nr:MULTISPECIES: hypothetical protein [unclassified Oleiphilus]KZY45489.1 hypothetical protein A3732_10245 [Oleiphilus sp. HI0050]KZZ32521.1 hypothetical protein A3757_20590 [Oleiphilus sp. HI0117]KZZ35456.1 hypothetical protein A3756_15685 [Oleiphilus sp. HI0086]KZZ61285.1 hypothetical protein A3761_21160 [Oleiphilus sp. HI0123]